MRLLPALAAGLAILAALPGCLDGILPGGEPGPRDYLSSRDHTKWVIEVDTIQGQAPPGGVLDLLRSRLAAVADKPDGVEIRVGDTLASRGGSWSVRDILDYSHARQGSKTSGKTVVTHLLFLDGEYVQENVLGVTLGHGPIAIFSQTIRSTCTPLSGCLTGTDSVFRAVLVHEFGHAMGLVNNGIPMVRPHEAASCQGQPDRGHSSNTGSVMHCAIETTNVLNVFRGGPPSDFDGDDRADLCDAGGKC